MKPKTTNRRGRNSVENRRYGRAVAYAVRHLLDAAEDAGTDSIEFDVHRIVYRVRIQPGGLYTLVFPDGRTAEHEYEDLITAVRLEATARRREARTG